MLDMFDRVFVLNLPARKDRRAEVEHQLHTIGCAFDSRIRLFEAVSPGDPAGFRSIGARGCFLSHLGALEAALQAGAGSVLILEDDVNFVPGFIDRSRIVRAHLNETSWKIFYGGYAISPPGQLDSAARVTNEVRQAQVDLPIGLSHFVAFNGDAIERSHSLLSELLARPAGHVDGGPMDVDGAYNWVRHRNRDLITLLADPQLGHQRASPSDIAIPKWFDRVPVIRSAASIGRSFKNRLRTRG
jgi:glycosyl transferase, family 25